jgi:hypothetical protein
MKKEGCLLRSVPFNLFHRNQDDILYLVLLTKHVQ